MQTPKMETDRADKNRPRIQVVDYVYKSPTPSPYQSSKFIAYCDVKCLQIQKTN